ncbi:hypothetical protein HN615_08460 [Candidatus Woesearchaeota archaeon]|jgi:hypothetical protein|nr:hypothetical protein [Candidatus Woesearchaeota archaeon]
MKKINKYFKTKFGRAIFLFASIAIISFAVTGISFVLSKNYSYKYDQIKMECNESTPYAGNHYIRVPDSDAFVEKNQEWFDRCSGENSKSANIYKIRTESSNISNTSFIVGFGTIALILLMFIGRWVYFGSKKNE